MLQNDLNTLKHPLDKISCDINNLHVRDTHTNELEKEIDSLEIFSRIKNMKFIGVSESGEESYNGLIRNIVERNIVLQNFSANILEHNQVQEKMPATKV